MRTAIIAISLVFLSSCSHVHLSQEAREQQCKEYGHKEGTPAFGECMQKERTMAQEFLWGDTE